MIEIYDVFWEKALENLEAAQSELLNHRYNSSANRSYYAAFQAAISALAQAGIRPRGPSGQWGHDFVQAQFNGELINRRHRYPAELRPVLDQNYALRRAADYTTERVTETRADRAVTRTERFLDAVRPQGGARS